MHYWEYLLWVFEQSLIMFVNQYGSKNNFFKFEYINKHNTIFQCYNLYNFVQRVKKLWSIMAFKNSSYGRFLIIYDKKLEIML